MDEKRAVLLGLSGGVDSSVAAFLLKEQGYKVTGCFMRAFDTEGSLRECEAASKLAGRLGIDFVVKDMRREFRREVVKSFLCSYIEGRTPNPCCICNRRVKWPALLGAMEDTGSGYVATGHYAGVEFDEASGRWYARRAMHLKKDQSYVLYDLSQEELSHTLMPLYAYRKEDVRELAGRMGLSSADKPDSQEICFIESGDYADFILSNLDILFEDLELDEQEKQRETAELRARIEERGSFVDAAGRYLGEHEGIINYTIGQRKGLGIALGRRAFVKEIRSSDNTVVLADDEELYTDTALVDDLNFQLMDAEGSDAALIAPGSSFEAFVKIRYGDKGSMARLVREEAKELRLRLYFFAPVRAVTPGQAAVFYDAEGRILGGGRLIA